MKITTEKRLVFCTASIVQIKESMRAQIADANLNKANGEKDEIINYCQPYLDRFTELLSDEAENAWVEQHSNLV